MEMDWHNYSTFLVLPFLTQSSLIYGLLITSYTSNHQLISDAQLLNCGGNTRVPEGKPQHYRDSMQAPQGTASQ